LGDGEDQGPYYFQLGGDPVSDCNDISLSLHKRPSGSETGKQWNMRMELMNALKGFVSQMFLSNRTKLPVTHHTMKDFIITFHSLDE
jgi:hypothetical protein